jgi:hypothetical protein
MRPFSVKELSSDLFRFELEKNPKTLYNLKTLHSPLQLRQGKVPASILPVSFIF